MPEMSRARKLLLFVVVALVAAAGGAVYRLGSFGSGDTGTAAQRLYAASFPDLQGRSWAIEQWRGQVLIVNFWATWCPPCREEIPLFVRLQERYRSRGLQFVGIAIDQPEKVAEFAREFSINYPMLIGGTETIELMRAAGNRAGVLPYTLIFDSSGKLVAREPGGLKEAKVLGLITPLL